MKTDEKAPGGYGGLFSQGRSIIFSFLVLAGLVWISSYSYLLFHGIVEVFSVAVAWAMFFLAWNTRRILDNNYLLFLGIAYLFIGALDLLHTLALGTTLFPGYGSGLSIELWIGARYMEALTMVLAPLFLSVRLRPLPALVGYCLATALLLTAIFTGLFPACWVSGHGLTGFKIASEYVISGMLAVAFLLLYRKLDHFEPQVVRLLLASIVLTICGEITFTLYFRLFSLPNIVGHFFKALSFYLIYKALIVTGLSRPFDLLFRNLKISRENLAASEARYRLIYDNSPVGIIRLGIHGDVVDANDTYLSIMGVKKEELGDFNMPGSLVNPGVRAGLLDAFAGKPGQYEGEYTSVISGKSSWLRMMFNPLKDEQGAVMGVIATFEDIGQRKQAEALKEHVDRMARHDLKGTLGGIIGLPQLMAEDANLSDEQRRNLKLIRDAGYRILNMVNSSLDLYKMETGQYEVHFEAVDMVKVASAVAKDLTARYLRREIGVAILVQGREPGKGEAFDVLAEELLCHTLLSNLVKNALEACPDKSAVTVAFSIENGRARMDVRNPGMVPEEVRDRFFEKYVTAGKNTGTGLGTYSARLIAETLGGAIGMRTSEEETEVTVFLLRPPAPQSPGTGNI